jgi:hypothetical protein
MKIRLCVSGALLALQCTSVFAAPEQPLLHDIAQAPEARELERTVQDLVHFGTRHTLSDTASNQRGIGAARRYVQARFEQLSRECGGCLSVIAPAQSFSGPRAPQGVEVVDVVAVQLGQRDPGRVVILTGHLDSRVTDIMNVTADAPGADDDASGVAVVLESARILSKHQFPATIVYGVLSGEEQGLYGGKVLADHAKAQGWRVEGDLNNDIVGGTHGMNGVSENTRLRLFSEGTRDTETPEQAQERRFEGGENDSPSRNLARYIKGLAETYLGNWHVALVYRLDRFGRGGDHSAFNALGFPAVRFTEGAEDYRHQHQDLRTEGGIEYGDTIAHVDFPYLARVTATNALTTAALVSAPPPPAGVKIAGAVTPDTQLSWQRDASGQSSGFKIYWRDTTEAAWTRSRRVDQVNAFTLQGLAIDDFAFGVASVSAQGYESPVVFPGSMGAF